MKTSFGHADPATHWRQRLNDGLMHDIGLVIAKAVQGQLAAGVPKADIVRQAALFGAHNRDGWGVGLNDPHRTPNLMPALPEDEAYLALFHGARRVAADCDGQPPGGNVRRSEASRNQRPSSTGCGAGQRFAIARRPSVRCSRRSPTVCRPLCSPTPCSPPRPRGPSPTPDTHSTSSTRRSNAWT